MSPTSSSSFSASFSSFCSIFSLTCGFIPSASTLATWLSRTTNAPLYRTFAKRQGTYRSFGESGVN
jgi:hypothetical protein